MKTKSPNTLLWAILSGIVFGTILGGNWPEAGHSVAFLGELFLKALFVLVVPLVMSSIIVGVTSLGDVRRLGPLGGRAVLYFMTTTGIAVVIGLVLVLLIQPGTPGSSESAAGDMTTISERLVDKPDSVPELLRTILTGLIPKNLFSAMANADVLPLIIFSLVFGGILTTVGERGRLGHSSR